LNSPKLITVEPVAAALPVASAGADERARGDLPNLDGAADRGERPLESDIAFRGRSPGKPQPILCAALELIATALRFSIRMTNRYKGVRLASVADHKKGRGCHHCGKVDLAKKPCAS
jgi:hypothetical protein